MEGFNMYYIAMVVLISLTLFAFSINVLINKFLTKENKRYFILLFVTICLANITECIASNVKGETEFNTLFTNAKFIELSISPLVSYLALKSINGNKYTKILMIPVFINVIIQIISLPTGIVFRMTSDGVYIKGPFYPFYIFIYFFSFFIIVCEMFRFSKKYQFNSVITLTSFVILSLFGVIIQIIKSDLRIDWSSVALGTILLYAYYCQLNQQIDFLSKFLCKRLLDLELNRQTKKESIVIIFDFDDFKGVNDNYGHDFGDETISEITKVIYKSFHLYGKCYRFGGDEFCVILNKGFDMIDILEKEFYANIKMLREKEPRYCDVTMGYSAITTDLNKGFVEADQKLYLLKKQRNKI